MLVEDENSVAPRPETTPRAGLLSEADAPTPHEHLLLLERRRAEADGYEVPLDSEEAAAYIGSSLSTVIDLVLTGGHPCASSRRGGLDFLHLRAGRMARHPR
jgi:hypothetical protein